MMHRFQLVGVTMLALLAFGALTATSASAQTFLLAEWLVGGAALTTELLAEVSGELLLTDTGLKAMVLCSGIADGWFGANSLGWVSEVLSLSGGAIGGPLGTGTPLLCVAQEGCSTTAETPNVWPVNLPTEGEVELLEETGYTGFVGLALPTGTNTSIGWAVECTILGVKAEDTCTAAEGVAEIILSGTTLVGVTSEAFTELAGAKLANCSLGGTETGVVEGEGTCTLIGGGEVTVSSEGVVS
jgi:hypothetical protein